MRSPASATRSSFTGCSPECTTPPDGAAVRGRRLGRGSGLAVLRCHSRRSGAAARKARLGEPYIVVVVVVLVVVVMTTPVVEVVVVVGAAVVVVGGAVVVVVLGAVLVVVLVLVVVVPAPNTACQASANAWPLWPGRATIDDVASSSTRLLVPAGAGRPTTALTAASSEPSPFGPHPVAPGTANVLSPCTAPLITIVANWPFGSGTPFASKFSALNDAFDRSVFAGIRRIGSTSEPMKQLGPRSTF